MKHSRVFVIAGEPSGDLHASLLVSELLRRGDIEVEAVGGPALEATGARIFIDSGNWGAMGIPEALRKLPMYLHAFRRIQRHLQAQPPDLLVLVDFGAFNMRLLKALGPQRPSCFYYFPPSSWDHKPRDRSDMAQLTDCVATPFPWSEQLLREQGVNAHFTGHPVIDRVHPAPDVPALRRELGIPDGALCLGLLPGSRLLERRLLAPQMLGAARLLAERFENLHVLFSPPPSAAGGTDRGFDFSGVAGRVTRVKDSARLMQAADFIITSYGTATLEAAAAGCPMLAIYRGTALMWLQWRMMKVSTDLYAMPNIIAGRRVVPETITPSETTAVALAQTVSEYLGDAALLASVRASLADVRGFLGKPGAAKRAAQLAMQTLDQIAGRSQTGRELNTPHRC